jgi:uncharacterized membrane protein
MNKMHTMAKIAAGILGIYLLIRLSLTLMQSISMLFTGASAANTSFFVVITMSLLTMFVFGGAVFYFLIYRSDIFARRVVGREDLPEPPSPSAWYPFALRLAVIIAGFIFLLNAITLSSNLARSIRFMSRLDTQGGMWQVYEYGVFFLIYLAISIYLLCGAPHFVRWQVKKTARLCREFPEK